MPFIWHTHRLSTNLLLRINDSDAHVYQVSNPRPPAMCTNGLPTVPHWQTGRHRKTIIKTYLFVYNVYDTKSIPVSQTH